MYYKRHIVDKIQGTQWTHRYTANRINYHCRAKETFFKRVPVSF